MLKHHLNASTVSSLSQGSGVILLDHLGSSSSTSNDPGESDDSDSSDDSHVDVDRPVSPCNVTFVGANITTGKSSLRSKPKERKVRRRNSSEHFLLYCVSYVP